MAFDYHLKGGLWSIVFTVPADGHKFKHLSRLTSTSSDQDEIYQTFLNNIANPDAKVLALLHGTTDAQHAELLTGLRQQNGDGYIPLDNKAIRLTQEAMDALKGQPSSIPAGVATSLEDALSRAGSRAMAEHLAGANE